MTDEQQQQTSAEPVRVTSSLLGEKKIEQLSKQPIIESFVTRSQDGKWIVHKTMITDSVNAKAFTGLQSCALQTSSR